MWRLGVAGIGDESRAILVLLLLLALTGFGEGLAVEMFEGDPCKLASGEDGVCRRSDSCSWLRMALRKTEKIVHCGFDHDISIVCCKNETNIALKLGAQRAEQACKNSNGGLSYHILYGVKAQQYEMPFIAALGYIQNPPEPGQGPYKWDCGSSLISPRYLLTAAHCMLSGNGYPKIVRMGTLNLRADVDSNTQDQMIKNIILHPDFKKSQRHDDIALIEVANHFLFDETVTPICLYTTTDDVDSSKQLLAAGWGETDKGTYSPEALLVTNLTTVSVDECGQRINEIRNGKRKLSIRHTQYCAIGVSFDQFNRSDTCRGDSGGPLFYIDQSGDGNKYYLVGITSHGINCGSPAPAVYTRVASYLDWVASHVWPEGE